MNSSYLPFRHGANIDEADSLFAIRQSEKLTHSWRTHRLPTGQAAAVCHAVCTQQHVLYGASHRDHALQDGDRRFAVSELRDDEHEQWRPVGFFAGGFDLLQAGPWVPVDQSECKSVCQSAAPAGYLTTLGFKPVAKSIADQISIAEGYDYQIIYALGDPLDAKTAAFKNDGTDTDFHRRAGDHHDGMEWFGLGAAGRASNTYASRGLLAINHEATTDEKLTSFFIHSDGGKASLPRPASEVDKELDIHGLSVVEVEAKHGKWSYKKESKFNRRVTLNTEVELHGPLRGSSHAVTKFSKDGKKARGTLNNCGTGKTPLGTFVSGEENWNGYFFRDAQDDQRRGKDSKDVVGLNRYGRRLRSLTERSSIIGFMQWSPIALQDGSPLSAG